MYLLPAIPTDIKTISSTESGLEKFFQKTIKKKIRTIPSATVLSEFTAVAAVVTRL